MKQTLTLALLGGAALALGIAVSILSPGLFERTPAESQVEGLFWPEQKQLGEFAMVDHRGQAFGRDNLAGHWNLVFFGYTHCPDICPITMSVLREADGLIDQAPEQPWSDTRVVFVSVDGERDTPEHLANYISFFDPDFIALTGDRSQVDSLTGQLGVPYEIEAHEDGDEQYLVSHTGSVFLISPQGHLAAIFQAPHEAPDLAQRYMQMRTFLESNG